MKKYLLPENGTFYKANLHCHTNISDGKLSPAEVKELYMAHGYSIVAYTDHEVLIPQHENLSDEHFLALNAHELEVIEPGNGAEHKTRQRCHMCIIALEPDNVKQTCWHRSKYLWGNAVTHRDEVQFDETLPDYVRAYSAKGVNDVIRRARAAGFWVTYNHPVWSLEDPEQFLKYEGFNALEIYNHGCVVNGFDDDVPQIYDNFLKKGTRIFCVADDDNHCNRPAGHPRHDACGGFTMIKADKLEYRTITKAMEAGNFYASNGPLIHELWFEDGMVHVKCDPAARIVANYGVVRTERIYAEEVEGELTEMAFSVKPNDVYIRITVYAADGKHAYTNAYFADELYAD
ncbi:MAG: PHP domain-containing protein [Ruminococcaceae bacterium]|nr:PHP domain-containing protein [Oscillospiraceae bacterium]